MSHPHILQSWHIDPKGNSREIPAKAIAELAKSEELAWIHLDVNDPESRKWIESEVSYLDQIIIDALLAKDTRPRLMEIGQGALLILRGINTNPESDPEDMVALRMWIDPHRIITLQRRPVKSVTDIVKKLEDKNGPHSSGEFLSMICGRLFDYIDKELIRLSEDVDDVEDAILEDADISYREKIVDLRREAIIFRKFIAPQREVINQLIFSDLEWIKEADKRRLRENLNQILRYIEELDSIRERAQIVQDELSALLSDKLNKNLYVLSIVTAIFLPLGFLTGLFGINIGGMPGVDHPAAFWIFVAFLGSVTALQVIIFKIMRWF